MQHKPLAAMDLPSANRISVLTGEYRNFLPITI
jgi:hypothetical protein